MAPHRHQLPGQRRADDERQRAPQPHPPVVHADLLLPVPASASVSGTSGEKNRLKPAITSISQPQPLPKQKPTAKAGQQRQQAQGGD